MRHVLAVLTVGAMLALTTSAALAGGQGISGQVTQKFTASDNNGPLIAVNGGPYDVPTVFWSTVQVGDTVKYTGQQWEIVQTALGQPAQSKPDRAVSRVGPASSSVLAGLNEQPYRGPYFEMRQENMGR